MQFIEKQVQMAFVPPSSAIARRALVASESFCDPNHKVETAVSNLGFSYDSGFLVQGDIEAKSGRIKKFQAIHQAG